MLTLFCSLFWSRLPIHPSALVIMTVSSFFNLLGKEKQGASHLISRSCWHVSYIALSIYISASNDMDFVDFFTEDLQARNVSPSPYRRPCITPVTRDRIDQLSSDVYPTNRPAYRGPPCEHEIEPPVMPLEQWLADEQARSFPIERLSNSLNVDLRAREIPSLQKFWTGQPSLQRQKLPDILIVHHNFPATRRISSVHSKDNAATLSLLG